MIELGPTERRAVLALLLCRVGTGVRVAELVDAARLDVTVVGELARRAETATAAGDRRTLLRSALAPGCDHGSGVVQRPCRSP